MPIIYMHGLNTRDPEHFAPVCEYLRRIVAPAIAPDPDNVSIRAADWFPLCEKPKWGGVSRPRTLLLGHGAEIARNELIDSIVAKVPLDRAPSSSFTSGQLASPVQAARIDALTGAEIADLIAVSAPMHRADAILRARIGIAGDRVAHDPAVLNRLKATRTLEEQLRILANSVRTCVEQQSPLAAAGTLDFYRNMHERVSESISRTVSAPAAAATVIAAELRPQLNDFVTRFLGDLLLYMTRRGSPAAPGAIIKVLLDELAIAQVNKVERDHEPIVLLTHSMGGQIAYDVITSFLPSTESDLKIDFWCATASQVGFFEELNMFLASSNEFSKLTGLKTPLPGKHLGRWWNRLGPQ